MIYLTSIYSVWIAKQCIVCEESKIVWQHLRVLRCQALRCFGVPRRHPARPRRAGRAEPCMVLVRQRERRSRKHRRSRPRRAAPRRYASATTPNNSRFYSNPHPPHCSMISNHTPSLPSFVERTKHSQITIWRSSACLKHSTKKR